IARGITPKPTQRRVRYISNPRRGRAGTCLITDAKSMTHKITSATNCRHNDTDHFVLQIKKSYASFAAKITPEDDELSPNHIKHQVH
ncbi:hypothetical protein TNIN_53041, partial [Trichonephila inaurata madagascariensis]